jgi:phage terminase large subunit
LAQLFSIILANENHCQLTIARKTLPALKATAMKDFFNVLRGLGMYFEEWHNKSDNTYHYGTNQVDFISVDEPTKVRSRRGNYLWLNEANEFSREDYNQLAMRTDKQIFMDYNPSHQYHWIYTDLQPRKDCIIIPSTYRDNPFLAPEIIKEIEYYKEVDQNYWRIYGLGLKGILENIIYSNWDLVDKIPEGAEIIDGLDFGYNNPTALIDVGIKDNEIYLDELIYESHLTNEALIQRMKDLKIKRLIYGDSSEPGTIEEIGNAGFSILPSNKDVTLGIKTLKSRKIHITKRSINIQKEIKGYGWKSDKDGKLLDEPIQLKNHAMDASRYAVHTHLTQPVPGAEWF